MGSVSQIGWEWYSRLSESASVTLVTHIRNRECLQAAGAPLPGTEIIYIDTEWFAGFLYRLASRLFPRSEHAVFLLSSADFYLFDAVALRTLRKRDLNWDLIHAVTPVSPVAATRLYRLGIPLIVGPWNGGLASPSAFPELMRQDSAWIYQARHIGKLVGRLFGCTRKASLILSATRSTDRSLPKNVPTVRMLENGVDLKRFHSSTWDVIPSKTTPLKVLFVGRLLPFKGVSLLLEAVSRVWQEIPITLTIVGDGSMREDLKRRAHELHLDDHVTFLGNLPSGQVAEQMRNAHVFCLPSIRESGGGVLLEAAASGLPVVAVNYGGPAEIVDEEVGHLVSADGPEQLIAGLVETFGDIWKNPAQWQQRGKRGRQKAEKEYGWEVRMRNAIAIYWRILGEDTAHA
ncbi:Glycosyl transferase, group 1 [Acidisarcina polymorpha]|uniref:Glycosyl transferase, group 1 n=2 Tax=Acidisarcina polymorpha TaxID=2211140 RepID=A0A2Z5FTJ2_9BACT|nr:Glycosyl transferase, group 1 [Acidisarcina polymorpha]